MVVLPLPKLLLFCTTPWGKLCCSTEEGAPLSSLSMLTTDNQLWLRSTIQADHLPTLSAPRNCSTKCYGFQSHLIHESQMHLPLVDWSPSPALSLAQSRSTTIWDYTVTSQPTLWGPVARLLGLPFRFSPPPPHARLRPRRAPLRRLPQRRQRARSWEGS